MKTLILVVLLVMGVASPVHADWNVNLSDYQTNENLTYSAGTLRLGSVPGPLGNVTLPGAVVRMNFNESSGSWAYDDTVYNNSAILSGGTSFTGGLSGNSLQFNGSPTTWGNISYSQSINFSTNLSVSVWVKRNETGNVLESLVSQIPSGGGTHIWGLHICDNNTVYGLGCTPNHVNFYIDNSGDVSIYNQTTNYANVSDIAIDDTNWHHICATYGANGVDTANAKIYLDGVLAVSADVSNTPYLFNAVADIGIGRTADSALGNSYNGTMEALAIYNKSLSGAECVALNNSYTAGIIQNTTVIPAASGYSIYQLNPSLGFVVRGASVTRDNNVNMTISYSVYEGSWSAYTTDISPYINNQYSNVRVNVTITNGNATNPWVSSITIVRGTGIDLLASVINSIGTVLSAILGIVPQVITLIAYFAVGGFVGGLFFMILDKMSPGGGSK